MAASLMDLIKQAGFTGQAAQTMYGIVMAESDGNAHAHNGNSGTGDNSYGLAQINMLGSMGPARMKQYGLSSNDDLFDPLTNLKVAYQLSAGGKDFTPWTTYTRGTYQQYSGQSGAVVTNSAGQAQLTGTAPGGVVDAKHTAADYKSALGDLAGLLTAVPELKGLLDTAIAKNQAPEDFANAIQSSQWYKQHNAATRSLVALQYSDPAEYQSKLGTQRTLIEQQATKLGVQMGPGRLEQLVHQSMVEGWDQQTLVNNIGKTFFDPKNPNQKLGGDIASAYQQMKQVYASYGVNVTDATLRNNALRIAEGMTTLDAYKTNVITAAKSQYPGLSTQLDQGLTVADIAQPYQSSMAQLLEVDPATLGLTTPLIRQALQGKAGVSADGKSSVPTTQPLWQFENQVRSDPRWAFTDNAHQQVATQLLQVGRDWGFSS